MRRPQQLPIAVAKKPKIDLRKLRVAMERDREELQSFREKFVKHVAEYCGAEYGLCDIENPVNYISLFVNTIVRHLVGADPRMMASTFDRNLRAFAEAMQDDCNIRLKNMKYGDIMRKVVQDAMFLIGITRTAIVAPVEARFGYTRVPGEPSVFHVAFEDFVCDTCANCFEECEYMGHRYLANYEDVKNLKMFDSSVRKELQPSEFRLYNEGGDPRIGTLGALGLQQYDRYEEYVELWEVYLPRYNTIITFQADGESDECLLEQDWIGPACGPYQFLCFQTVPGKLMPKGPVMDLMPLARSINHHWKHLDNQASQQKDIVGYRNQTDAAKIQKAEQGEYVQLDEPGGIIPIKMFGVNAELSTWASIEREVFNELAGNPRALGGLQPSAKTLGQEKLITASASKMITSMAQTVIAFVKENMTSLGWFFWNNPHQTFESTYQLPGMPDVTADRSVTPQQRASTPFTKMQLDIDPYSLNYTAPAERTQIIQQTMQQIILPALPLFQQPGVSELMDKYIRMIATYQNVPELVELLETLIGAQGDPQTEAQQQPPDEMQIQGDKTTTHERVSRPGMTDQGHMQELQQMMAGGQTNQGKPASLAG